MTGSGLHTALRPLTVRESVTERIRDAIVLGRLRPGSYIKETQIAADLEISPTPVREALMQLAGEGLIRIQPSRLKQVTPIDVKGMVELLEVKRALWLLGYHLGVGRLNDEHIGSLQKALERYRQATLADDALAGVRAWHEFNTVVLAAAGNQELMRVTLDRLSVISRFVLLKIPGVVSSRGLTRMQRLLVVLSSREIVQAQDLMSDHINSLVAAVHACGSPANDNTSERQ
jgi:DNA-binding GntR family transcriptional regulator